MKDRPSLTAMGIAVMRAIESEKPDGSRLFYDPYAKLFIGKWFYRMMRFFIDIGYAERRGPGTMGSLLARTKYMDDYLISCVKEGIEQLVILGAGYDSRAYRFDVSSLNIFEVDHPATQQDKKAKLEKIFGVLPSHVTFVPIDFTKESLEKRLFESGYDPKLKTLFIWEGVTYYITADAVDSTLSFIAQRSAKGSSVIFDYTYRSVAEGKVKRGEISNLKRYRGLTGESVSFGIADGKIAGFMEPRGFDNIVNVTGEDLQKTYFSGKDGRKVGDIYAIVHAAVKAR